MGKNKIECVKLEFTKTVPNNVKFFDINEKKYGDKINCTAKAAGKKGINYFSSKFKFTIDASSCKNPKITDIHIVDVTHIGKTNNPLQQCGKYHYYYNIYCEDSSSSCSDQIIDDEFEQTIYNSIKSMLMTAKVTKYNNVIRVTLTLPSLYIDSMCVNIRVGTDKFSKGSDCNDCSLSAVKKDCKPSSSSCSSSSSSSSSSTKCKKKNHIKKVLKYIAWSVIVIFIINIIKNKGSPLSIVDVVKQLTKSSPKKDEENSDE